MSPVINRKWRIGASSAVPGVDLRTLEAAIAKLYDEVGRLQNLLSEKDDQANDVPPKSSYTSPRRSSRNTHKCSSKKKTQNLSVTRSKVQYKESTNNPYESYQQEKHVATPVFTFANQAGLDMLETTLIALQDITLEKILDDGGRKILCLEFPKIMQQGFAHIYPVVYV
ncbi:uncharacterized protein A4U43_C09F10190 [Asparagus officinalis]|uniref:MEKHLA domain-containing protein n=1 Tax=Asparagus officinalis TaxID=4686 RepID=A0A5P1E6R7_ASPOF|nr:uncharacterized protein A4U43_C09F10190 [Asparagus officinalis]